MKTLKKDIPVLLAAALFAVSGLWQIFLLRMIPAVVMALPYFLIALTLLRRRKDFFPLRLILTTGLLLLMRFMLLRISQSASSMNDAEVKETVEICYTTAQVLTAGMVILFVFVLLDGVDGLKKFRVFTGPLWPVPGALMLLADLVAVVRIALLCASESGFFGGMAIGFNLLIALWSGPLDGVAVLLLGYWLYARAPEELEVDQKKYEGGYITEAELEEKRRKLGLQKRKVR